MIKPKSVQTLTDLGRVRLSKSFFMRDFLFSDIAAIHGLSNIPDDPDLAIKTGTRLCEDLLEPLQDTFGRIAIRSAYRSAEVNGMGNAMMVAGKGGYNCATNADNAGGHIWDLPGSDGRIGATACIVVPSFWDAFSAPGDWQKLAWWIHDHLPYSSLYFHPRYWAFNITWSDQPSRRISSYPKPTGTLTKSGMANNTGSHETAWTGIVEAAYAHRGKVIRPSPADAVAESASNLELTAGRSVAGHSENDRPNGATSEEPGSVGCTNGFPAAQAIVNAVSKLVFSKCERAMLAAHLAASDHTLSASELASAAGFTGFSGANAAYGKLGHRLSDQLGWVPIERNGGAPVWTYMLAFDADAAERTTSRGRSRLRGVWRWRLRPELIVALEAHLE